MYRSSAKRLTAFIVSVGFALAGASALLAAQDSQKPKVSFSVKHGKSAPLRDYRVQGPVIPRPPREIKNKIRPTKASAPGVTDRSVQRAFGGTIPPTELLQFEGGSDDENEDVIGFRLAPPDTEGDIGPNHYVQYINLIVNIYDRDGNVVQGPLPGNVFWEGLGTECETSNDGDPIVLYDQLADRWFVSQFAFPSFPNPPYIQCVAVSETGDPTGAYNQYQFNLPDTYLNDYPKFGIWPDGYYMTFNGFDLFGGGFQGAAIALDREAMLVGDPAAMIQFDTGLEGGVLPADMDGMIPPPPDSPNYFLTFNLPPSRLIMWAFHADFETPANSTFVQLPDLPVDEFVVPVCGNFRDACVPQLDSPELLETLSQATMFRLAYRNFGDHESLVTNHTVAVSGEGGSFAGVRWYELQIPGAEAGNRGSGGSNPWAVHQQQTYAPDENWRWMGSIAQDTQGNMALGYSISSEEMHPSIAITGRLVSDPLNQMGLENIFLEGGGSQINTAGGRWGDYSSMSVDPLDDCTFWYTQEYCQAECEFDWKTRIASFKFASCTTGPTGTIEGTVTDGANPIEGATVKAGSFGVQTDAAGHYEFTLPVENSPYDLTASKYGFFPASADDVPVVENEVTVQDFTLEPAPSTLVNGTVTDALGTWPLYARIQVSGPGYPGSTIWTNPVTGYYGVTLVEGITYTFLITAASPGYETGGGTLNLGVPLGNAPLVVQNWTLEANPETCNAPGYTLQTSGLFEEFSGGVLPPGWEVTNSSTGGEIYPIEWVIVEGSDPCGNYSGNLTGGTGPFAVSNSDCPGSTVVMDTTLTTPSIDLSSLDEPRLKFNQDFRWLFDNADVDVSTDGGSNWTNVLAQTADARGPMVVDLDISDAAGESDVKARFHNYNAAWAWWWQVDNVLVGEASCIAGTGGLVVGRVFDGGTDTGIIGATVTHIGGNSTKTFSTPDLAQPNGLYILYAEAGPADFEASYPGYQPDEGSITVVPGTAIPLDFELLAGNLSVTPSRLDGRTNPGGTDEEEITVTNSGAASASFEFVEINAPLLSSLTRGFASDASRQEAIARLPQSGKGPAHTAKSAQGLAPLPNTRPAAPRMASAIGDVISSWETGIAFGWGVATDLSSHVWLSNIAVAGGDDQDYQFNQDGSQTGNTIDLEGIGEWAADGALDFTTGNIWRVAVGGDNCIYELDVTTFQQTGNTICGSPWTGTSQRGLAYDAANDTFFIGGWNEGVVYHFDRDGNTLDSAFVALSISGLAYNPGNGHLFAMENDAGDDVTVLDALDNYNVLGAFDVMDGGSPAFGDFEQAGIEFDCIGALWAVNQITQVAYQIESGEAGSCEVDIPWFQVVPETGEVTANGGTFPVSGQWDAGVLLPGLRQAQLSVKTDTPYDVPSIPVTLTVRFLDVPDDNQFEAYIYGVAGAGIMFGGPPVCPPGVLYFCPDGFVTRADMAGYLWRGINGRNTPPPVYQNIFADVTFNDYNSFYIQGIYDLGVTAGCLDGSVYCPDVPVTRAQMSALVWRSIHGEEPPPPCTPPGVFADVPCPSLFADYIEALAAEGVTAGCGGGNFCPHTPISNGQMAVFIAKAFGIPVVLPPAPPAP